MPLIRNFNDPNLVPLDNPIEARKNDLLRITEWLKSPAGIKFAGKQALLRTTGNLESFSAKDIATAAGRGTVEAASAIATILAQVPLNGTGTHFLFNELSSLAFKNNSFYIDNRNAANQANYTGTINIKKSSKQRGSTTLESMYNPIAPGVRERGEGVYDPINENVFTDAEKEDLVKLVFRPQTIVNGRVQTLRTLQFRGYFKGDLSDSFDGSWANISYVGRGETFYTYDTFKRNISFGFSVAAMTEAELEPMTGKLNALASLTAPTYSYEGFMRGTLVKLTIGDYINNLLGIVDSVTLSSDFNSSWEVTPGKVLPMVSEVSVKFTPIHNFVPQTTFVDTSGNFIGTSTYIKD